MRPAFLVSVIISMAVCATAAAQVADVRQLAAAVAGGTPEERRAAADALADQGNAAQPAVPQLVEALRSEEHTSELQSLRHLVCRLLLENNKIIDILTAADA